MSDRWPQWPSDRPPPRLRDGFLVERRAVGLIISTGLISIVLNITATLLIARAIDQALGQGARTADVSRAYRSAALAALAYATGGVFWITQGRITTRFVHRFANRIRIQADELIGGTRLVDLKRFGPTDIHGRLTNDVENLTRALQSSVSQLSNSLILTVGLIGVMLWVSPLLAAVTVGTVAIGIVLTRRITALARPLYGKEFGSLGALNSTVLEWLGADAPTRAMLRRARHTERLDELAAKARLNSFRAQRVGGLAQPLSLVVSYGGYLLVIIIGVFELRAGRITVGALQAMLLYARQVSGPLFQLAALSNLIQSGLASWGRVAELGGVRGVDGTPDRARASAPPASVERLVIEGVSLAYTDASDALSDIDLTLQRGDVMFLVGETGSGKSTLGALIAGLHAPDRGRISFIPDAQGDETMIAVGYVPQDAYLFQGTVGDNLLVAGDGAADGVADAADRLGLSRLVAANPEGLAVEVAVAGRDLPLAHRQAISLLRAYLGDQSLIVLDEATSALDVVTEARVLDAFRQKCADGLLVVVSHRLDNIGPRDSVIRLTDGSIIDGPSVDYPSAGDSGNHYSTGGPPLTRTGQQERSDP